MRIISSFREFLVFHEKILLYTSFPEPSKGIEDRALSRRAFDNTIESAKTLVPDVDFEKYVIASYAGLTARNDRGDFIVEASKKYPTFIHAAVPPPGLTCSAAVGQRVVEILRNNGLGLNLTDEVRDGIAKHSKGYGKIIPDDPNERASTIEGNVVRIADIMAYLNHDLDDAIRSGVVTLDQIPSSCINILGRTHSERANTMIKDLVYSTHVSDGELVLQMGDETYNTMTELRHFLYENVYRSHHVHKEFVKAKKILSELYVYFLDNDDMLQKKLKEIGLSTGNRHHQSKERVVCDFIASMTDRYALTLYEKIFFPSPQF